MRASSDSGDGLGTFFINEKFYEKLQPGAKIIVLDELTYCEEFIMPLGGDLEHEYHIVNCKTISKKR